MNAVILAGGYGSRLHPLTDETPKPMLKLANMPMIDYTVAHLRRYGYDNLTLTLGFKPEKIIEWAVGYKDTVCHFTIEDTPLGTCGGVKAAWDHLDDCFIVVSGDALSDINFDAMVHKHRESKADVTMAVTSVKNPSLYGVVDVDEWGMVRSFAEKPKPGEAVGGYINCGVYVINKYVLNLVPDRTKYDFSRDLFPDVLQLGNMAAYIHDGYWSDIGDFNSFYASNFDMAGGGFFEPVYNYGRDELSSYLTGGDAATRSLVANSASVVGQATRSIVGSRSRISSGSVVDSCVVLDDTVVKGRYSHCIIGPAWSLSLDAQSVKPDILQPGASYDIF